MKKGLLLAVIGLAVYAPGVEARITVGERAARFAARDARAEGASGYLVQGCRRRQCWVTLYGIWSPIVDERADLSGWVILPKGRRAYWRDFD